MSQDSGDNESIASGDQPYQKLLDDSGHHEGLKMPHSSSTMVRDRTSALRAASDAVDSVNSGGEGPNRGGGGGGGGDKLDSQDGEVVIEMKERPRTMEIFYGEVSQIQDSIDTLQSQIDQIRKLTSSIVSPLNDEKETGKSFEDLTFTIQRTAEKIREKLQAMKANIDSMSESSRSSVEFRIKDTQHTTLQRRFADMMYLFYQLQTEYREKCKKVLIAQLEVKGMLTTDDEIDKLLETKDPQVFTDRVLNETQMAKSQLADIQARHTQFLNLEKSIRDLRDLFFDVYMLVEQQGEMIDRIEYQVGQSRDYVERANEETAKALIYQQKARRKKFMIYVCLGIVLLVIVGVIVLSFR